MATQSYAGAQLQTLQLTAQEAAIVLEALELLCNVRRYSFKEPDEDIVETHRAVFETARSVADQLRSAPGN